MLTAGLRASTRAIAASSTSVAPGDAAQTDGVEQQGADVDVVATRAVRDLRFGAAGCSLTTAG